VWPRIYNTTQPLYRPTASEISRLASAPPALSRTLRVELQAGAERAYRKGRGLVFADAGTADSEGPAGTALMRVVGTLDQRNARCLIDTGATHNFVSSAFIRRHQLQDGLLPTDRRVKSYDGTVSRCAGMFVGSLVLRGKTGALIEDGAGRREFLVAELHKDDIVLGMPWCSERIEAVDFRKGEIALRGAQDVLDIWKPVEEAERELRREMKNLLEVKTVEERFEELSNPDKSLRAQLNVMYAEHGARVKQRALEATMQQQKAGQSAAEENNTPDLVQLRAKLLKEFADVFPSELPDGLPPDRGHALRIELQPGAKPAPRRPTRINNRHTAFEDKWVKENLKKQFIRPSKSQYAAPHFFVDKPDSATTGEYRGVTDFRELNRVTRPEEAGVPHAQTLFDKLQGKKYFTKIDLRTGFYQILIAEEDRHKTAFLTSQGLFEYNVLPMGLRNSPAVFMRLMNDTFRDCAGYVMVFLDDIVVYSDSLEDHERHVRAALQKLREQRLFAKLSKSAICQREVEFLGHWVGHKGMRVMEDKIAAVRDWPTPTNISELRAFLGLAGYYRRFVKDFSRIALPLTELTRNVTHQKLGDKWGAKEQTAFEQLQRALQHTPLLTLPDSKKEFIVHCDASGHSVGAVLQQEQGNGLQPIAYLSKKMDGAQTRYPVHEQELLAIITALTTWRHYLEGTALPVRVRTDHKSLMHFQTQPMLSGRQQRWAETLSRYNYVIEYVKGKDNPAADALSRRSDGTASTSVERAPVFVDNAARAASGPDLIQVEATQTRTAFSALRIMTVIDFNGDAELRMAEIQGRRAGRERRAVLAERVAKEKAIEAATRVIPQHEVDPTGQRRTQQACARCRRSAAPRRTGRAATARAAQLGASTAGCTSARWRARKSSSPASAARASAWAPRAHSRRRSTSRPTAATRFLSRATGTAGSTRCRSRNTRRSTRRAPTPATGAGPTTRDAPSSSRTRSS